MKWHQRFFWILLLLLPTQLGVHFWPEWAGVLGRRVDYLAPTVYLTDILILFTVGTYIIFNFKFSIFNQFSKLKNQIFNIKYLSLFGILLFVVINIIVSINKPIAVYKWIKVGEFVLLGWYVVRIKPKLSAIIAPLSIGVLYSSVLAIAQFILQHSVGGPLWWLGERTFTIDTPGIARIGLNWSLGFGHWDFGLKLRPYATFPHPNVLGGYIAALVPAVIISREAGSRSARQLSNIKKIFCLATVVFGVIALVLTFSRSAVVVGGIAIATILLFRHSRESENPVLILKWIPGSFQGKQVRNDKKKIVFIVCFLFFLSLGMYRTFPIDPSSESVVVRQQLNTAAIKLWATAPLFGIGLGNFLVRLPEALPSRTIYFLQPVHNIYLLLLSEVGVVGLAFFAWFLLKMSRPPFSIWHVAFSILLVLGLVDHYPLTLQQGQLLLTVFAAMSLQKVRQVKK